MLPALESILLEKTVLEEQDVHHVWTVVATETIVRAPSGSIPDQ